jgi:hypothetical protein
MSWSWRVPLWVLLGTFGYSYRSLAATPSGPFTCLLHSVLHSVTLSMILSSLLESNYLINSIISLLRFFSVVNQHLILEAPAPIVKVLLRLLQSLLLQPLHQSVALSPLSPLRTVSPSEASLSIILSIKLVVHRFVRVIERLAHPALDRTSVRTSCVTRTSSSRTRAAHTRTNNIFIEIRNNKFILIPFFADLGWSSYTTPVRIPIQYSGISSRRPRWHVKTIQADGPQDAALGAREAIFPLAVPRRAATSASRATVLPST